MYIEWGGLHNFSLIGPRTGSERLWHSFARKPPRWAAGRTSSRSERPPRRTCKAIDIRSVARAILGPRWPALAPVLVGGGTVTQVDVNNTRRDLRGWSLAIGDRGVISSGAGT